MATKAERSQATEENESLIQDAHQRIGVIRETLSNVGLLHQHMDQIRSLEEALDNVVSLASRPAEDALTAAALLRSSLVDEYGDEANIKVPNWEAEVIGESGLVEKRMASLNIEHGGKIDTIEHHLWG